MGSSLRLERSSDGGNVISRIAPLLGVEPRFDLRRPTAYSCDMKTTQ